MELRPISTAAVTLQTPDKSKPSHAVSMEQQIIDKETT